MFPMDFIDFSKATEEQLLVIVLHDQCEMEYKKAAWRRLKYIRELKNLANGEKEKEE